ncbi:winged helix-turn-helix transcriptional regulator [Nocardia sp. NPDC051787]|uniref:winged helix-turn-helix transcriptional regulator n=1 Tax=Nocardia sp. NPDC051787 TaxID=3155415 RepID=UPI003426EB7B
MVGMREYSQCPQPTSLAKPSPVRRRRPRKAPSHAVEVRLSQSVGQRSRRRCTGVPASQRLEELEQAEVVERVVTVARPVEVRYALTPIGRELEPVLDAVLAWSVNWAAHQAGP